MNKTARIALVSVGGVVTAGAIGMGVWSGLVLLSSHDVRAETSFGLTGSDLTISSDNGSVRLVVGEPGAIRVERKVTESIASAHPRWTLVDNRLTLDSGCPSFVALNCDASYVVHVPGDLALTVRTDNGSIRATGFTGALALTTDNGSITVRESTGELRLRTDNGSVNTYDTRSPVISAATDNGSVNVRMAVAPTSVDVRTDNGDARVQVPPGPESYNVSVSTDNGNRTVNVPQSSQSPNRIVARTDNGDVRVDVLR
jgi:hypothetical protein